MNDFSKKKYVPVMKKNDLLIGRMIIFLLLISPGYCLKAQSDTEKVNFENHAFSDRISMLRAYVKGNELSYPVIEFNSGDQILCEFDDRSPNSNDYYYEVVQCDNDWKKSQLFPSDYLDGFDINPITNYEYSVNTLVSYVHYQIDIPNDDLQLKVSGNYQVDIFEGNNREKLVAVCRFSVYESVVAIQAEINRPLGAGLENTSQEIKLTLQHDDLPLNDPFSEIKVMIVQNYRADRVLTNLKPVFIRDNELVYSFSGDNLMLGGNEFRSFDIRTVKRLAENVNDIKYVDTMYQVQLRLDESRSYMKYFWEQEMNGNYLIYLDNGYDYYKTADYVWVHFTLDLPQPFLDGSVYVFGNLTNWECSPAGKLSYNADSKQYQGVMLLKQGYYNYEYVYRNTYTGEVDEPVIEGTHYETENNYLIYVYYRNLSMNFDRLVGYRVINSKYN